MSIDRRLFHILSALTTSSWIALAASHAAAEAVTAPAAPAEAGRAERQRERNERCARDPRVLLGQVSLATCIGADLFFRETFGGNGRTCASCHPAQNNYTIDPAYIATLKAADPLFIAERDPALQQLEVPVLLREQALIVANPDGFEDPANKFVLRSVQHMLGLAVSTMIPSMGHPESAAHVVDGSLLAIEERLGWSGDGAPGRGQLRDFADGAIVQHATRSLQRREGVDFFLPNDVERDSIAEFSRSIGRMNDLDLQQVELTDAGAARGLESFRNGRARECGFRCHTNAGAIETFFETFEPDAQILGYGNVTLGIHSERTRLPEVDALGLPFDGGHGLRPDDHDGDGILDSFGNAAFNVPPLIEAADTGPMFHTNGLATLEDAIRFYTTEDFASSLVGGSGFPNRGVFEAMPLKESDIAEVGRFLRVLNTSLNLQMALRRIGAAIEIVERFRESAVEVEQGLLLLAAAEVGDALEVLGAVEHLHDEEQRRLRQVFEQLRALSCGQHSPRRLKRALRELVHTLEATNAALGSGTVMQIGPGTLMF